MTLINSFKTRLFWTLKLVINCRSSLYWSLKQVQCPKKYSTEEAAPVRLASRNPDAVPGSGAAAPVPARAAAGKR